MKVALPTNNGEKIARHASLCRSFLIVDTETGERVTALNPIIVKEKTDQPGGEHERGHHGTGRIVPDLLVDLDVEHYVCLEAGDRLRSRLRDMSIGVSVVTEKRIDDALKQAEYLSMAKGSVDVPEMSAGRHFKHGRRLRHHHAEGCETGGRCHGHGRRSDHHV